MLFVICCFFFFFQNQLLKKYPGTPSYCQTVWIQFKAGNFVGPDLGPNLLQSLSAIVFFQSQLLKKFFHELYHQIVKQFGSTLCQPEWVQTVCKGYPQLTCVICVCDALLHSVY